MSNEDILLEKSSEKPSRSDSVLERVNKVRAAQNGSSRIEAAGPKWGDWKNFDNWSDKIHWIKY